MLLAPAKACYRCPGSGLWNQYTGRVAKSKLWPFLARRYRFAWQSASVDHCGNGKRFSMFLVCFPGRYSTVLSFLCTSFVLTE